MEKKAKYNDHFRHGIGGHFTVVVHRAKTGRDETRHAKNIIVDAGIKHFGDILVGDETTDIDLGFIEPDAGVSVPAIGDTDTETHVDGGDEDRLAAVVQSRNSVSPFEVVIEGFIGSSKFSRPFTISKLNIFFTPDESGVMFASGLLDTPITVTGSDTVTLTYGIVLR